MNILGKLASVLARKVLLPAVIKIATNPKAPLTLGSAKDAIVKAAEAEALRQAGKRIGVPQLRSQQPGSQSASTQNVGKMLGE